MSFIVLILFHFQTDLCLLCYLWTDLSSLIYSCSLLYFFIRSFWSHFKYLYIYLSYLYYFYDYFKSEETLKYTFKNFLDFS